MIFSPVRLDAIKTALSVRANKLFNAQRHFLPDQDFIDAFIKPEHIPVLKTTQEICGAIGTYGITTKLNISNTNITLPVYLAFYGGKPPIIIPQYVAQGPHDLNNFGVQGLVTWLEERVRQGVLLGDALDSLEFLNAKCADARAFRAVFPAIAVLVNDCARSDDPKDPMRKLAARIQTNQAVKTLPRLPREVMQRLIAASDLINATTLLEDQDLATPKGHALCHLSGNEVRIPRPSIIPDNGTTYRVL